MESISCKKCAKSVDICAGLCYNHPVLCCAVLCTVHSTGLYRAMHDTPSPHDSL